MNITNNHIEMEFNRLFNGLSDQEKRTITNHLFNNGLPEFPNLFKPMHGQRIGQWFLNNLPIEMDEHFSSIFYCEDSDFIKEQIQSFIQKIFNDPIQNG